MIIVKRLGIPITKNIGSKILQTKFEDDLL